MSLLKLLSNTPQSIYLVEEEKSLKMLQGNEL
jgi:hypothetical protein